MDLLDRLRLCFKRGKTDSETEIVPDVADLDSEPGGHIQSAPSGLTLTTEGDEPERGSWGSKVDFLLSCIGYAVGLGNVWRFPYLCYRSGGGAFLIPYVIMLAFAGLPLFFLELALGQFASLGATQVWKVSPLFKGLGCAMVIVSALVSVYYNMIITYTLFYLFASFTSEVPWKHCDQEWNTDNCLDRFSNDTVPLCNEEIKVNCTNTTNPDATTPSQEYWERYVLGMSDGLEELGAPRWQLTLTLLLAWIIIFLCLCKGVKSSGKVVYFTATFPYVVLFILLIRGATLEGSLKGVEYYITPQWHKLGEAKVWGDAAVQIFYSLGPAWGGLITMASYNKFDNNCYRDAIIVAVINCATSVFAGFVIFSMIGYMHHYTGLPIENVTTNGPGLAFVAYPEGLATMDVSPLWSILFFFMLFTLGLDSQFVACETVLSALEDEFPKHLRGGKKKILTLAVFCAAMFVLGLPLCCPGGIYLLTLMDTYSAGFSLMIIAMLEGMVLMYIYGFRRFSGDIEMMIGFKPNYYWLACWLVITPALITFIIIFSIVNYKGSTYGKYDFPMWGDAIGWLMVCASLSSIPVVGVVQYWQYSKLYGGFTNFREVMRRAISPTDDWGPALKHRTMTEEQVEAHDNDIAKQDVVFDNIGLSKSHSSLGSSIVYESYI